MAAARGPDLPPLWPTDRRYGVRAGLLAFAVLIAGLVLGTSHELGGYLVENDFYGQFYPAARALLDGRPMANPRSGPGYPLLLAAGALFTDDLFAWGKVLASVALAGAGWLTFLTVRAFVNANAALVAQMFSYAILGRYCIIVGNDLVFVALAMAALCLLLQRQQPSPLQLSFAGACAGAAMAVRYPGVALIPTAIAALWLWPAPASTLINRVRASLLFAVPLVACSAPSWAAPWLGLSAAKESKAYAFVALDVYASPKDRLSQNELDLMETRFTSMQDVLTRDPRRVAAHYAVDYFEDALRIAGDSVTLPAALFLGAGFLLWLAAGAADRRRALTFLLFPLVTFCIVALVPYQARYGYGLVPAAAALVGTALTFDWSRLASHAQIARTWPKLRAWCLLAAFLPPLAMTTVKLREYLTTEPTELLAGADALRRIVRPSDKMVGRKAHLASLSGAIPVVMRLDVDLRGYLAWARRDVGARFVQVGDWEVRTNSALRPLLAESSHPGLRLVWENATPAHRVYELLPE
jgi:hypothetical protein